MPCSVQRPVPLPLPTGGQADRLPGRCSPSPLRCALQGPLLLLPCIHLCAPARGSCGPCCAVDSRQAVPGFTGVSPLGSLPGTLWALIPASGPLGKEASAWGLCPRWDQVSLWPHSGPSASQELTLQMNLLELIRKLQQRGCQAGKAAL